MDSYEKEVQKSLQNQADRVKKQQQGVLQKNEVPNKATYIAKSPALPDDGVKVLCQFCAKEILREEDGIEQRLKEIELKFRCCRVCRDQVVGPAGLLDRNTPGLVKDRKL